MRSLLLALCTAIFLFWSQVTFAEEGTSIDSDGDIASRVICNIILQLSGPVSQAIATLVIIITGYSFFVGKVSIGMLFVVAAGIMFVFGAQTIMGWILGAKLQCVGGDVTQEGKK